MSSTIQRKVSFTNEIIYSDGGRSILLIKGIFWQSLMENNVIWTLVGQWGHTLLKYFSFRGPYKHRGPYIQVPLASGPKQGATTVKRPLHARTPTDKVPIQTTRGPYRHGALQKLCNFYIWGLYRTRGPYRLCVIPTDKGFLQIRDTYMIYKAGGPHRQRVRTYNQGR